MRRAVAVTGIGLVSPHGDNPETVFDALMVGRSAVSLCDDADCPLAVVARAPFDSTRWFSRMQIIGVDRVSQIAVAAADAARVDSGLDTLNSNSGIYLGTGMGGAAAIESAFQHHHKSGRIPPLTVPAFMPNAPAAHVAMRLGIHGPVYTYSVACASSAIAIAEAAKAVAYGDIDCALAGGSEALLVPSVIRAWHALHTLASPVTENPASSCRPFSADRSGMVLGEGAAFMVLEPYDSAVARGARIYARVAGSGVSCDATHITKPDVSGQVRALQTALQNSNLSPIDIGYCNAHGTATRAGDIVECEALGKVWGDALGTLKVSSTKSMHGHLLGAAGALEAFVTVMALYRNSIPPNMNCDVQDTACGVKLVRETGISNQNFRAAISNSFAFGGTNVVLVFERKE